MNELVLVSSVSAAGGFGAVGRYLVDNLVPKGRRKAFPWGTAVVNVSGSLLLGFTVGTLAGNDTWRTIVGTGLLGGYTTFSTASVETLVLITDGRPGAALANGLGLLVACVVAASLGLALGRLI